MATRFHIAAKQLKGGIAAYAKRFDFLEVQVLPAEGSTADAPKTTPSLATLRKWRREVPPSFEFAVVAGPHLIRPKAGPELDHEVAVAKAAIDALQARCLLLRTPADVTPSALWRERIKKLLGKLPTDVTQVAWEPSGPWETDEAALTAKRWGVTLVVDAARDPVPPGAVAYVRLRALGETRSYGLAALERVVKAVGERRDAYVVLETDGALAECKRLRQVAQRSKKKAQGGLGRVLRPRALAPLAVRDDEQE